MGAWIEIFNSFSVFSSLFWSHPTMGAWIEIKPNCALFNIAPSRTPRWVRGLKLSLLFNNLTCFFRRTPRWVRGLKFKVGLTEALSLLSHPTMGAWIEICIFYRFVAQTSCRTPRWVRGLKFFTSIIILLYIWSHPTMGAWIEIFVRQACKSSNVVAPHDGCVD